METIQQTSKPMWIDIHAHIDKLSPSVQEILESAKSDGVFRIITIGTELKDWREIIKLCEQYSPELYGTLGMPSYS